MAPAPLAVALGRIAQAVSGALELKDVFTGVAEAAATVLPFDIMAVGRLEAMDTWTVYAISGNTEDLPRSLRTEDVSPAIRVAPGSVIRIDDAERELDPRHVLDRRARPRRKADPSPMPSASRCRAENRAAIKRASPRRSPATVRWPPRGMSLSRHSPTVASWLT